jgi:predicted DNA-binding protein
VRQQRGDEVVYLTRKKRTGQEYFSLGLKLPVALMERLDASATEDKRTRTGQIEHLIEWALDEREVLRDTAAFGRALTAGVPSRPKAPVDAAQTDLEDFTTTGGGK